MGAPKFRLCVSHGYVAGATSFFSRSASAIASSLLLAGCWFSAPVDTAPVDTAPPTDSADEDSAPPHTGPCPRGAPEGCVAFTDGVCFVPELPVGAGGPRPPLTDEFIAGSIQDSSPCAHVSVLSCGEGRFVHFASLGSDMLLGDNDLGFYIDGFRFFYVYDAVTREAVALSIVDHDGGACPRTWYGDVDALSCYEVWAAVTKRDYQACHDPRGDRVCDLCTCRVNTVTDVQNAACEP